MSRGPPQHSWYQPPPPPQTQQYYDEPPPGSMAPPHSNYSLHSPNVHHFPHNSPGRNDYGEPYQEGIAGPSRQDYFHQRVSPNPPQQGGRLQPGPSGPPGPLGGGWSSIHPSAAMPPPRNDMSARGGVAVKLEDLVTPDRPRQPHPSPTGGPGGFTTAPLNSSQPTGGPRPSTASHSDSGLLQQQVGPSEFIKKLFKMLEEESAMYGTGKALGAPTGQAAKRGSVGWGRNGTSFVVWDMNDFTTKVLPQTFRHSNFSSFVRQLNKYGFSKIKHVDEDTGQLRENVWEFQHPSFQAGRRSDLDNIKRKVVVPKRGAGGAELETETSPPPNRGGEEYVRIMEVEARVNSLEDALARALDDVQEARNREMGLMTLVREMIGQMAQAGKASISSPRNGEASPTKIARLYQLFDQVTGSPSQQQYFPPRLPLQAQSNESFVLNHSTPLAGSGHNRVTSAKVSATASQGLASPRTDGSSSRHIDRPSPAGSMTSSGRPTSSRAVRQPATAEQDEVIELSNNHQTLYNGDPVGLTPNFAETPAWLTEGTTAPIPMYHRKSSDGATMRLMVEALSAQNGIHFLDDSQDPLDASPVGQSGPLVSQSTSEHSPFGKLLLPTEAEQGGPKDAIRLRRSTVIQPHWTQTPRILVVEDDVVYRQLSSKFLQKFGCITDTVDDAQGAVEQMNRTKYDLVLMDIFFGPSMDGRKAASLIRQFDIYTPIISMTSNVQTQDVNSYLQSGMNDVLAKPFTKHGLFSILDKHLMHLKAIQLSAEVPRSLGLPPLSDQGVQDAVQVGALEWGSADSNALRNPLAAMGWSDETYQLVLQQFLATGSMPEVSVISNGTIGTSVVFGDTVGFNRKRSIESINKEWTTAAISVAPTTREIKKARK